MALTKITVSGVPHFCGDWNTTKAATGYKIYAIVCNEGSCFCSNVSDNKVEPKILSYDSETGEYTCSAGWNLVAIGVGQEYITEITTLEGLVTTLSGDVDNINDVIPTSASSSNKLVDKSYVDSAIATSSAVFRGTSEPGLTTEGQFLTWANTLQHDLNDYVYWNTIDSNGNIVYKRYKYDGGTWVYEYDLNNSSFSAEEWEAIQSGITAELVTKLNALPSNVELTSIFNTKQNVIQDLSVIRSGAAAGATAYQLPDNGIPKADLSSIVQTSLNKADSAYQKPQSGIPKSDLTSGVQASLDKADSAYQKANTGIPKSDLSSTVQSSLDKADSALQQHQDITGKADKDTDATPGNVAKFDENGNPIDSGLSSENIARKDGSYDTMSVGLAKNLEGRTNVTDSFFERTTGGDAEVANGLAQMTEVGGNSVKFNQLICVLEHPTGSIVPNESALRFPFDIDNTNGDNNYQPLGTDKKIGCPDIVTNHHYYINVSPEFTSTDEHDAFYVSTQQLGGSDFYLNGKRIAKCTHDDTAGSLRVRRLPVGKHISGYMTVWMSDLTAIFGTDAEIAAALGITTAEITTDAGVAAFEAWLASNIGKRAYYPYDPGSVLNVNMAGIETVGRNLLNPTTGKARIIGAYSDVYGNYYGITGTHGAITFTSDMGETSTITPDEDGKFLLEEPGELSVADAGADCCVFLWWDGTQTDYVEHKDEKTYLDATHIYGKLNGTGDLVRVWPTGMPKIGELKDLLRIEDGQVVARRIIGEVDMGVVNMTSSSAGGDTKRFTFAPAGRKNNGKFLCEKYQTVATTYGNDKKTGIMSNASAFLVYDAALATATVTEFKAANSGVFVYYELATPQVYTDLVYQGSEYFADGTPVTLPLNYPADNWGIERVLPINTSEALATAKPELTCKYSIDAVETMNTHADEIEDLYDKNEELDARKPEKYGEYPNMVVGSAKNIDGDTSSDAEFKFRKTGGVSSVASGVAKFTAIYGKSLVWNQQSNPNTITCRSQCSITKSDGVITVTPNSSTDHESTNISLNGNLVSNHIFLYRYDIKINIAAEDDLSNRYSGYFQTPTIWLDKADFVKGSWQTIKGIKSSENATRLPYLGPYGGSAVSVDTNDSVQYRNILFVDLTLMFGAGNEPTTVAEFEAMFPLPYYAYNPGEIISNKTQAVEVTGRNQWDEEWENGKLNDNTGAEITDSTRVRAKNFIPVIPNTEYCFRQGHGGTSLWYFNVIWYDANKNYIRYDGRVLTSFVLTSPANAAYCRFYMGSSYGATYQNDVCINLSDPSFNGQYEPYKKTTVELNIPTLTGKLNGEGESVVIATDGLCSAGTVYDEGVVENGYLTKIVKRIGKVDLGTLTFSYQAVSTSYPYGYFSSLLANGTTRAGRYLLCEKYAWRSQGWTTDKIIRPGDAGSDRFYVIDSAYTDAATFKTAMSGVELYFELAEPLTYVLDTPLYVGYQEYVGGTEKILPEDTSVSVLPGLSCKIAYPIDIVKAVNELNQTYLLKTEYGKIGVVSQTQTWTGNEGTGYDYTMSNLVRGIIPQSFIELAEAAGAVFNATTGYFEVSGLTDVSYEEMRSIYAESIGARLIDLNMQGAFTTYARRTTLPIKTTSSFASNWNFAFYNAQNLEIVTLDGSGILTTAVNAVGIFQGCTHLKAVIGGIKINNAGNFNPCAYCYNLETIQIRGINGDVQFAQSSKLTLASVVYLVDNAANTAAITITLHATAYARCQADTTSYTYNDNTYTGVIAYAAAKNITIQSA